MFINDGVFNNHVKDIQKHIPFVTASNSGNTYSIQIDDLDYLEDGQAIMVKFNAASTGAISVSVNGGTAKSVVDYFGNAVTNVRAGLIAHLVYSAGDSNFQLQGKGGDGDAIAADLLINKKATVNIGPIVGTMPRNNGDGSGHTEYNGYSQVSNGKLYLGISLGAYVDVSSKGHPEIVVSDEPDIAAGNIKPGVNIFGVGGTFTNDATAVAEDIRDGKSAYVNGQKVTGSCPVQATAAQEVVPGTSDIVKPAGIYDGDITIKGIQPSDIGGRKFASGGYDQSDSSLGSSFTVSSLTFTPSIIYVFCYFIGSNHNRRYSLYNILIPMRDNNDDTVNQFNFGYSGSSTITTDTTEYIKDISPTGFTYSSGSSSYDIFEYHWFAIE